MQINEYRIGNFLYIHGALGRVIYLAGDIHAGNSDIHVREVNNQKEHKLSDGIQPIGITREWLLRFGFTEFMHPRDGQVYSVSVSIAEGQQLMLKDNGHSFYCFLYQNGNEYSLYPIVNVHQLQNLFYALTVKDFSF